MNWELFQPKSDHSDLLEQAGDDAHEALKIAEQTGYIWPKVEALELLAAYHQTHHEVRLAQDNSETNLETLQRKPDFAHSELAQRYANEAAAIKKGLFLTEEQMQDLKAQARQEFERQIAGWEK